MIEIEEAMDLIETGLGVSGFNVIPNLKSFKVKDLFEIFAEEFGLIYRFGKPRISEKIHEMMVSKEEAPRTHLQDGTIYMHYKEIYNDDVFEEFTSNSVVLSKTELKEMLKSFNYFKPLNNNK